MRLESSISWNIGNFLRVGYSFFFCEFGKFYPEIKQKHEPTKFHFQKYKKSFREHFFYFFEFGFKSMEPTSIISFRKSWITSFKSTERKYIKCILRTKFRRKKFSQNYDHQSEYYKNLCKYCENALEPKEERVKPLSTANDCEKYFKNILTKKIVKNASHLHRWWKLLKIQSLTSTLNHQLILK